MTDFSLNLNEDQLQIQKWVHDFAENVIRPAAHEWDEREEFPYPIVEEAAQIGLYGFDFMLNAMGDATGLTLPVAVEEVFWGDAGIGMAIMGSGLAAAGIAGTRHAGAGDGVGAAVLRHRRQGATRGVLRERARRRLGRVEPAHPGRVRRGDRRVGAQRHQGVDHQRRHRRRARGRRRRRSRAEGPRARLVRGAARHEGTQPGTEVPQARHPCEPHRRGRARRRAGARARACSVASRASTRSWPGRARAGTRAASSRR